MKESLREHKSILLMFHHCNVLCIKCHVDSINISTNVGVVLGYKFRTFWILGTPNPTACSFINGHFNAVLIFHLIYSLRILYLFLTVKHFSFFKISRYIRKQRKWKKVISKASGLLPFSLKIRRMSLWPLLWRVSEVWSLFQCTRLAFLTLCAVSADESVSFTAGPSWHTSVSGWFEVGIPEWAFTSCWCGDRVDEMTMPWWTAVDTFLSPLWRLHRELA